MLTGFKEDFYYFPYGSVYVYTMFYYEHVFICLHYVYIVSNMYTIILVTHTHTHVITGLQANFYYNLETNHFMFLAHLAHLASVLCTS
jgi:hypothetical protein